MRTRKLFAILLAGMLSTAMLCGAPAALASEVQPTQNAPETVLPTESPVDASGVLELSTVVPVVVETEQPSEPDPSAEEAKASATEVPAEETKAPAPATESPIAGSEAPAEETKAPAADKTPVVELSDKYAYVDAGTAVYAEKSRETRLGVFPVRQMVYVSDVTELENGSLYEVRFDTEATAETADCIVAYFYAADLQFLTLADAEAKIAALTDARVLNEDKIPVVEFTPAEEPEPTKVPEIPTGAYINADDVNVRALSDVQSDVVTKLALFTPVTVLHVEQNLWNETWYLVRFDGGEGYVRADFVTNATVEAPEAAAAPDEEEELTLAERIDETNPDREIRLNVAWDTETPALGSTATLSMDVVGYEGLTYTVSWQCDKGDGWETVSEGETTLSFVVNEENLHWQWRAGVNVTAVEPIEAPAEEAPSVETPAETDAPAAD